MSDPEKQDVHVVKKTFEFVLKNQENLRDTLMMLAREDRPLRDDERGLFFLQLSRSTLGLGVDISFTMEVEPIKGRERIGSVEYVSRWLAMQTESPVKFMRLNDHTHVPYAVEIPIGKIWGLLLLSMFDVFPLSLNRASSMSKETDATSGGAGFGFDA